MYKNTFLGHFQAIVEAYDTANPGVRATATVYIDVIRNPNAPAFIGIQPFQVTINDRYQLGQSVIALTANDADGVSQFSMNIL